MYKKLLTKFKEKSFNNLYYFFRKCNLLKTRTCKFVAITQKLKIFYINLLGNYYSTLHNLSYGIQYVSIVRFKTFSLSVKNLKKDEKL